MCMLRLLHGSLGRAFTAWHSSTVERLGRRERASAALAKLQKRQLATAFRGFADAVACRADLAARLGGAVARLRHQQISRAFSSWMLHVTGQVGHTLSLGDRGLKKILGGMQTPLPFLKLPIPCVAYRFISQEHPSMIGNVHNMSIARRTLFFFTVELPACAGVICQLSSSSGA